MNEFLDLLRRLPRSARYLGVVFLLIPIIYVITRGLGIGQYWWVVVLGLVVIALLLMAFNGLVGMREKKRSKAFEGELRQESQKGGASRQEVRQALGDLSAKWAEASEQLRQAGLNIYSLPWYLLIGEPQSGKSTTLKNSGLEFPVGTEALSGAGGTRNCDWWFANEAVILDTAGRFTFQEDTAPDQDEWSAFLRLLKKYRKYCPINGVLVVIPSTSLLEDTPEEQEKKATNIRQKLMHVQRVLQIRFPVFILVTKADRVLGFSEFFSKLDPIDQQQLVGWSNPDTPGKAYNPETFDETYEEIAVRLHKLRLKLLADEDNPAQADKLFVFPEEFGALKDPLKQYFKTIFLQTRFDEPFAFRGYYFSSGVQQGKPIAQATRDLLETPGGASQGILEDLEQIFKKSRAFFIRHFYEKKVFPEQGLISRTKAAEAKQKKTVWAVRILMALVVLIFLGGMVPAYRSLQQILKPVRKTALEARNCAAKGCSVAESYRIASELEKHRERIARSRLTFALFLRGPRSNELNEILAGMERKVYFDGVVAPLLAETEGRMAALDWGTFGDYTSFFNALQTLLDWRAIKTLSKEAQIVKPADLRVLPLVDFARKTKGLVGTDRAAEVDTWVAGLSPSDPGPDQILAGASRRMPETVAISIPDPARPIAKFEEYWTVANLARWDFRLQRGLAEYVRLYGELGRVAVTEPQQYLSQYATVGRQFRQNYEETSRHLATPRPGEKGFPGATPALWKKYFTESYSKLLTRQPVAPGLISPARRDELLRRLDLEYAELLNSQNMYSYLLARDPAGKPAWSSQASGAAAMLNDLSGYSDLATYAGTEDGKILQQVSAITSWEEKPKKLEEWRKRQEDLAKGIAGKADGFGNATPDPRFGWAERRPILDRTTQLALLWRTLPLARKFFGDALGAQCPPGLCYQSNFARLMIPSANAFVSFSSQQQAVAGVEGVSASVKGLAEEEAAYLRRYNDQLRGGGGGGGGFSFPYSAASAGNWRAFQGAIASWQPQGGGGGGAAPLDSAGQLALADIQAFAAANDYLRPILDYYVARVERPRAAAAGATVAPEILAAAEVFKNAVTVLSDQPLRAWKQLATGTEGVSLKDYRAFSGNPRVRSIPLARRLKTEVEDHGAHLIRDAIRPQFRPRADAFFARISGCCLGKFPFINEVQLETERRNLDGPDPYSRSGTSGAALYRVDLPTIATTDITGMLAEFGALSAEFALGPIFSGEAREFNFAGDNWRVLSVAYGWERFLFAEPVAGGAPVAGLPEEQRIAIRLIERAPTGGAVFIGDRVGQVNLFDRTTILRPSTDVKTGRQAPPYVWRLASADAPLTILGRNEETVRGWTGALEITGGPLKLFYFIQRASEPRRPEQDERIWNTRIEVPDAERPSVRLQGVVELRFEEPLPGVVPR